LAIRGTWRHKVKGEAHRIKNYTLSPALQDSEGNVSDSFVNRFK